MSSAETRDESDRPYYELGFTTAEQEAQRRRDMPTRRKMGASSVGAVIMSNTPPFTSKDARTGQEVDLPGVDYTPSEVSFDPAIKQRQRADERHYDMLVGARHMLQDALDNPDQHQRHEAAKVRAKIEKTEKQLVDNGMLPAGYIPLSQIR